MPKHLRDWKKLRVGDRIRVVAIPEGDQRQFEDSGSTFTVRVLRRLIKKKTAARICMIDEYGQPWISYRFRNGHGKMEHHTLTVTDDESWIYAGRSKAIRK